MPQDKTKHAQRELETVKTETLRKIAEKNTRN